MSTSITAHRPRLIPAGRDDVLWRIREPVWRVIRAVA